MTGLEGLLTKDGKIMQMRAMGFSQAEIAKKLKISQPAVSQRMSTIRKRALSGNDTDLVFWEMFMGIGASFLLKKLFDESFLDSVEKKL